MRRNHFLLHLSVLLVAGSSVAAQSIGSVLSDEKLLEQFVRPNVLLVIGDDIGTDYVAAYGEHPDPGSTPVIDALASRGVLFRNAWSNPTCSPTRATILTGTYAKRNGVGRAITYSNGQFELSTGAPSLPRALAPSYVSAAVGKWHLSTLLGSGPAHPLLLGFDHHWGPLDNIDDFYNYPKSKDTREGTSTEYATSEQVDDALELIQSFGDRPWFVWLAFSAPHGPVHKPPADLHTFALPPQVSSDPVLHQKAMVEAMDTELGRLLATMDPVILERTYVIFVGDNGTPPAVITPPFEPTHGKATPYEGGINVPLIVAGPGVVENAECQGLVNTTDLFATITDLTGGSHAGAVDSVSLEPYLEDPGQRSLRQWAYAENFGPNGYGGWLVWKRELRNVRGFKLLQRFDQSMSPVAEELYDLSIDPHEANDLMLAPLSAEAQAALVRLRADIDGV